MVGYNVYRSTVNGGALSDCEHRACFRIEFYGFNGSERSALLLRGNSRGRKRKPERLLKSGVGECALISYV